MATLFLAGDVMAGRGVDQVLAHPRPPRLHEGYVRSAREHVELAERENGPIAAPVGWGYVRGEALGVLERKRPDARIVNMRTLAAAGIATAGAGEDAARAAAPAAISLPEGGRILVSSFAEGSSGVPREWAATPVQSGVNRLPHLSSRTLEHAARDIARHRRPGDLLNDGEGIGGYREYQPEPRAMYFPALDAGGRLVRFEIVPMALRRFRIARADASRARALATVLAREPAKLGTRVEPRPDGEPSADIMERAA